MHQASVATHQVPGKRDAGFYNGPLTRDRAVAVGWVEL